MLYIAYEPQNLEKIIEDWAAQNLGNIAYNLVNEAKINLKKVLSENAKGVEVAELPETIAKDTSLPEEEAIVTTDVI